MKTHMFARILATAALTVLLTVFAPVLLTSATAMTALSAMFISISVVLFTAVLSTMKPVTFPHA